MLNGAFQIEKLTDTASLQDRYRMYLEVGGVRHGVDSRVTFDTDDPQEIKERLFRPMIAALLNHVEARLVNALDRLYAETETFDSTAENERRAQVERARRGMAISPPPASFISDEDWFRRQARRVGQRTTQLMQQEDKKNNRAMSLLKSKIGEKKFKQLEQKGYFEEQGKHGTFRFHKNTQGGVSLIERKKYGNTEREVEWTLCVQSMAPDLPKGDVILSRWMEWKADEDKFLDTANFRDVRARDEATQGRL